ncbi:hypothetical protein A8O14_05870 [Polynucleobacter wuianus]|uniref:Lipoprotein n=1 Tax=Polynucleobacter wuianus TaxID=1743168 RepID=A0A191UF34_9BURK|nr:MULTISPECIES: hypothetical protein [Polynucleobacter]ANI99648.1 hypothetical protein A8O14_05870 [Polynucleobacter wuianus]MBU3551707.1 hypothetical protein [Polynucleobacter sp. MWH-Post4-6-1]
MKKLLAYIPLLLLQSCTSIGSHVQGWPQLQVSVHETSILEVNAQCWKYLPLANKNLGSISFGCSIYNLNRQTCDIYIPKGAPQSILEHEMEHCSGGDHLDHSLEEAFNEWLDMRGQVGAVISEQAPRLVPDPYGSDRLTWDHSSRFGPISPEMKADADLACSEYDLSWLTFKATGYHPAAQNLEGEVISNGGYFCEAQ